jgi:hypothetical protein
MHVAVGYGRQVFAAVWGAPKLLFYNGGPRKWFFELRCPELSRNFVFFVGL